MAVDEMKLEIPKALRLREELICSGLKEAIKTGGDTGEAVEILEAILLPHLSKEDAEVLQPLGLLPRLARGEASAEMAHVLPQIEELKKDLRDLRVEHATILSAIKRLVAAARAEDKSQHARFAERLLFRAWLDESVFTPLAILIGEYLDLRLQRKNPPPSPAPPELRAPTKLELPEALQLSHVQLSAALTKAARAGGRTAVVADAIAQILEPHLEQEEAKVLRILGLLGPLAAGAFDPEWMKDEMGWEELETNESALHLEHRKLVKAGEELLAIARQEHSAETLDFAERLLLRIRLDEEIFYRAALFIRKYLRLRAGKEPVEQRLSP
jgi:hypothetical protein